MFSSRLVCVVALCGALVNIEYSNVARADEMNAPPVLSAPPEATIEITPEATPEATPQIDIVAQQLLREMSKTYANLKSFSSVAVLGGTTNVPKVRAAVAWQNPARFNIQLFSGKQSVRTVSNGREVWQRFSASPNEYQKETLPPSVNNLGSALRLSGAGMLLLAGLDFLIPQNAESLSQLTAVRLLPSNGLAGVDVVAAGIQINGEKGEMQFSIDRKSHLLKSVKLTYTRDGVVTSGIESYSNVRINPALPATTFQFALKPTDKIRVAAPEKTSRPQ